MNNPNTYVAQQVNSIIGNTTADIRNSTVSNETYTVKTVSRSGAVGEDIYIYDKLGNPTRALLSGDAQYVEKLVGNYLVLDI